MQSSHLTNNHPKNVFCNSPKRFGPLIWDMAVNLIAPLSSSRSLGAELQLSDTSSETLCLVFCSKKKYLNYTSVTAWYAAGILGSCRRWQGQTHISWLDLAFGRMHLGFLQVHYMRAGDNLGESAPMLLMPSPWGNLNEYPMKWCYVMLYFLNTQEYCSHQFQQ